jgi:ATP-dependent RNA helicase DDX18/HAS1
MLFSATQTAKVTDLARVLLKKDVDVHEDRDALTADGLEQGQVVCDSDRKFLLFLTFLRKDMKRKVIVLLSNCNSVEYHAELFKYDIPILSLHASLLV